MTSKVKLLALALAVLATPVRANDLCAELWFVRNLAFDRAGYCFSSPLGQAKFDNGDCTTKNAVLSRENAKLVEFIRDQEKFMNCAVNNQSTRLSVPFESDWRRMRDLAGPNDGAFGCLGWNGPDVPLRWAHNAGAGIAATGRAGMTIIWDYESFGPAGWDFLSLYDGNGNFLGMGWSNIPINEALCSDLAG